MSDTKVRIREIAQLALMSALMFVGKEAFAFLPNIHPVALIIAVAAIVYGWKSLYCVFAFVILEIVIYGFGIWNVMYLYIWPLLAIVCILFRDMQSRLFWALLLGMQGLLFGALCSLPYIFIGGFEAAVSYWAAGMPFDLIHGLSNFIAAFLLIVPLKKSVLSLKSKGD